MWSIHYLPTSEPPAPLLGFVNKSMAGHGTRPPAEVYSRGGTSSSSTRGRRRECVCVCACQAARGGRGLESAVRHVRLMWRCRVWVLGWETCLQSQGVFNTNPPGEHHTQQPRSIHRRVRTPACQQRAERALDDRAAAALFLHFSTRSRFSTSRLADSRFWNIWSTVWRFFLPTIWRGLRARNRLPACRNTHRWTWRTCKGYLYDCYRSLDLKVQPGRN